MYIEHGSTYSFNLQIDIFRDRFYLRLDQQNSYAQH